eukprot:scaffold475_cov279-Pinguiococcus_pyrenoidosus.AAC.17
MADCSAPPPREMATKARLRLFSTGSSSAMGGFKPSRDPPVESPLLSESYPARLKYPSNLESSRWLISSLSQSKSVQESSGSIPSPVLRLPFEIGLTAGVSSRRRSRAVVGFTDAHQDGVRLKSGSAYASTRASDTTSKEGRGLRPRLVANAMAVVYRLSPSRPRPLRYRSMSPDRCIRSAATSADTFIARRLRSRPRNTCRTSSLRAHRKAQTSAWSDGSTPLLDNMTFRKPSARVSVSTWDWAAASACAFRCDRSSNAMPSGGNMDVVSPKRSARTSLATRPVSSSIWVPSIVLAILESRTSIICIDSGRLTGSSTRSASMTTKPCRAKTCSMALVSSVALADKPSGFRMPCTASMPSRLLA